MSAAVRVELNGGVTMIRLLKRLDLEALLAELDEIAQAYRNNRRLWDLSDTFRYTNEEVRRIAAHGRVIWPGSARVAYLAEDDLAYGLLRMFEVYRKQENYQTKVFRKKPAAMAWLQAWEG